MLPLRLLFTALEPIQFPPFLAANILRGALGTVADKSSPLYRELFAPADLPRPFVLRVRSLDGCEFAAGESFAVGVNLFRVDTGCVDYLVATFARFSETGLGPQRSRIQLVEVQNPGAMAVRLDPLDNGEVPRVRVHFRTPTELKSAGGIAGRPEFHVLTARLRDRIGRLRELYGEGALTTHSRTPEDLAFSQRAAHIGLTRCDIHHISVDRRSTRTGQKHPLGGFIGTAEYEGKLAEFVPYLELGKWVGVGRQTTWGKGEIELENLGWDEPTAPS